MKNLCPFFKDNCHGNECVMWRNENCLLVSFLSRLSEVETPHEEESEPMKRGYESSQNEEEVPECLEGVTAEDLAVEMLEFRKKQFPEDEKISFHMVSRLFWENKGVRAMFFLPSEVQLKVDKANLLAQREITKQEDAQKRQKLEQEKEELPSLVSQCVDWARLKGLKRLALTDIDAFLFDKEISILKETKRILFSMANSQLKAKI